MEAKAKQPKKKKRYGDGLYERGKGKITTWWMDCRINGERHQVKLGKGINRTVAAEIAGVKRSSLISKTAVRSL